MDEEVRGTRPGDADAVTPAPHTAAQAHARARKRWGDLDSKKLVFLEVYVASGNISRACREIRLGRRTHYDWIKKDPAYAAAYAEAEEDAADVLLGEAWRRAVHGVTRPMVSQGVIVCYVQDYSDTLLLALLAARRPHEFGKCRLEHSGEAGGGASTLEQAWALTKLSKEDRDQLKALMAKAGLA
jgi:hypothetical protein